MDAAPAGSVAAGLQAGLAALGRIGWVDATLLAVLAVSVMVGVWRGFVFELMSLVGWVVAWFAAQWAAPEFAPSIGAALAAAGLSPTVGTLPHAMALALAFVGALLLWALLARAVRLLVHATPLSVPDRLLGAGFGLVRGGVLLLALATVVTLTPAAQSTAWRGSQGARWLDLALQAVKPLLPGPVQPWLRA
jgi:membrane protein required for colicin V production